MHAARGLVLGFLFSSIPAFAQGSNADKYDGCAFVSQSDVEGVMGAKLQRKPRIVRRTMGTVETYGCSYKSQDYNVEVRIETGRNAEDLKMYQMGLGMTGRRTATTFTPVKGLGDQALWGPVNPTNGILHVFRGTDVIWVQTHGQTPGAGTLDKTKSITDKVFAAYQKARK